MIRSRFLRALVPVLFMLPLLSGTASPFAVPEKLVFDLTWTGISTGTATLETMADDSAVRIVSTTRSAAWVSVFFTVDDRVEAQLRRTSSQTPGPPKQYRARLREGNYLRDKEVIFDHAGRKATFVDHITGEKRQLPIQGNVLDPLSGFYYVRSLKMAPPGSVFVNIFDDKRSWTVEVRVLRRERIRTKLGEFNTIVIKPLMKSEGTFNRKGDMFIWLTDDERHLPVKVKTKVIVGSVTATLAGGTY